MTGVRSSRTLETACTDQVPYLWLTGWQRPDHNTLWRFYAEHRQALRKLLKRTVRTAVRAGLVELALQAVDGSKIAGNAAKARTHDAAALERLLERTDAAIADLEAQNRGGEAAPARLPRELRRVAALKERVAQALEQVRAEDGPARVNLTDADARLMKGRHGFVAGYNGQAMVSPTRDPAAPAGPGGLLITAAAVTTDPDDHAQLIPMIEQARENTEREAAVTLADGGYHSGANLAGCEALGQRVLMPEAQQQALEHPYHQEHFGYDRPSDSYRCPAGQRLTFRGTKQRTDRPVMRMYRGTPAVCRACPAFGTCTTNTRQGRVLEVGPEAMLVRQHRAEMATEQAQQLYRQRQCLPEPTFGILKEQQGARRLLLRGLENVQAEWTLLATAFNLRALSQVWRRRPPAERWGLVGAAD